MSSQLQDVASRVRSVGQKAAQDTQQLTSVAGEARRLSSTLAGSEGVKVRHLLDQAATRANNAAKAIHEFARNAETFADRLATGFPSTGGGIKQASAAAAAIVAAEAILVANSVGGAAIQSLTPTNLPGAAAISTRQTTDGDAPATKAKAALGDASRFVSHVEEQVYGKGPSGEALSQADSWTSLNQDDKSKGRRRRSSDEDSSG